MLETDELLIFIKVVAASSVSRAAGELGVPRATVSRKLAALEERIGARLLQRTTRSMTLTEAGRTFHRHAELVLDAARAAESSVRPRSATPSGRVRVTMPPMTGSGLPELLADFARQHPTIQLLLHVANRVVDLRREPYDVAIRASSALAPGLVARTLTRVRLVGVAAPSYLATHGTPATLADLPEHRCLMGLSGDGTAQTHWHAGKSRTKLAGTVFTNDPHLVLRFALRGLGIAYLPATLVATPLARGELTRVLPQALRLEGAVSVVYRERKLMAPAVRAFVDHVVRHGPVALRHASAAESAELPAP
ncbi:MAG: Transcriptional regulator, LysR family protein [Polyangiaceae bacterium]|jgi:DNA-binding transcriptional LysR family regulator|nr:Transcriptional regulator, LysR family protein [Polyangiaceae bacterium]